MTRKAKHVSASDQYPIAQDESLLPVFRALYICMRDVERVANRHIESLGLTPSQFDALAVLGDCEGMTCKELGARSLISGGTLTPVLDRLEAKGLVQRCKSEQDSRQTIVSLTPEGQAAYEKSFLPHVRFMRRYSDALTAQEQADLVRLLAKLSDEIARTS